MKQLTKYPNLTDKLIKKVCLSEGKNALAIHFTDNTYTILHSNSHISIMDEENRKTLLINLKYSLGLLGDQEATDYREFLRLKEQFK